MRDTGSDHGGQSLPVRPRTGGAGVVAGPDGVTPGWLSAALGLDVVAATAERVGTGLVGMNLRVALTYGDGTPAGAGPPSVVVKLPSPDPTSRATGVALRNYEREVRFYADVAPTVDVRTPACWYAEWDSVGGDFVLVLEDLAPGEPGDQVGGCTLGQAADALVELARLHAPRWDDSTLAGIDWLSRRDADGAAGAEWLYRGVWESFLATYRHRIGDDGVALGERLGESLAAWLLGTRGGPLTVTHGDYRLDNLLFGTPAGGYPVAVVDWQTPGHGPGVADAAYFLGAGLTVPDRRAHERELLGAYHRALVEEGGVRGFGFDDCWEQYRAQAFAGCVMTVVASMIVGASDRSEAMFGAMAERHFRHALDLDSAAFLPG